jgi:hypothetical protein
MGIRGFRNAKGAVNYIVDTPEHEDRWNYSRALKVARSFLGPKGRVWRRDGEVIVGVDTPDGAIHVSRGADYAEALSVAFIPQAVRDEIAAKAKGESVEAPPVEKPETD